MQLQTQMIITRTGSYFSIEHEKYILFMKTQALSIDTWRKDFLRNFKKANGLGSKLRGRLICPHSDHYNACFLHLEVFDILNIYVIKYARFIILYHFLINEKFIFSANLFQNDRTLREEI